jgi:hypothetical protein
MGLRPCRIRVAYYEGGGRDFWAGHYEGGGRGLSWEVVPAKTHYGCPTRDVGGGSSLSAGILGCITQLSSDANGTCGCMCWLTTLTGHTDDPRSRSYYTLEDTAARTAL